MKASLFLILVLLAAPARAQSVLEEKMSPMAIEMEKADSAYSAAVVGAQADYRKAFALTLAKATRIEVFLLESFSTEVGLAASDSAWAFRLPADQFPIIPTKHSARILQRKELAPEEIKELMPSLLATVGVEENDSGALCHYPIHGIRVWDGNRIVFQTSVCYQCQNFYVRYPGGEAGFVGLSSDEFARIMGRFMPIPSLEDAGRKDADEKADPSGNKTPK